MKQLSEIGTHCKPDPNSTTQFEEHWILTKGERIELLKEAIHRWERAKWEGHLRGVSEFLKEQGL